MESIYKSFIIYRNDVIILKGQSIRTEEGFLVSQSVITRFFDNKPTEELTMADIRSFHRALNKKLSVNTVRGYLFNLKSVLAYAQTRGLKIIDPESIIIPKRVNTVPSYFTPKEVTKVIQSIKMRRGCNKLSVARDKAIVSMLYGSGIRASELCSLNKKDWESKRSTVIGKGNKPRVIFWDDRTHKLLKEYMKHRDDSSPALFVSARGCRLKRHTLVAIFIRIQKASGVHDLHAHALRHSYATNLMDNGIHIFTLSRLMGHSSIHTTSRYLHVSDVKLREEYERHHSI